MARFLKLSVGFAPVALIFICAQGCGPSSQGQGTGVGGSGGAAGTGGDSGTSDSGISASAGTGAGTATNQITLACVPGELNASASSDPDCEPRGSFEFDDKVFNGGTSVVSGGSYWCEPALFAGFDINPPSRIIVGMEWGRSPPDFLPQNRVLLSLYGDAEPTSLPATYQIVGGGIDATPGTAEFDFRLNISEANPTGVFCTADAGTVTITRYEGIGGMVEGSYDITSFIICFCNLDSVQGTFPLDSVQGTFLVPHLPVQ